MIKNSMLFVVCLVFLNSNAQEKKIWNETEKEKQERLAWWTHDRFGMFIHWGTYSMAARHEKVIKNEKMSEEQYKRYFDNFNPDLYNPTEWAKMAKAAGMKYAVITTKHHEGFSLFDSKYSEYKITKTPYGKDALKEWVDAFRAEGFKIGFYYSVIDWHHPDYTIDRVHPRAPKNDADYANLNKDRDMNVYRKFMKDQITELLTKYGKVDMLWLDFSFPGKNGKDSEDWDSVGLMKLVRKLQPAIIVNDRLDIKDYAGGWDFTTPEQFKVTEWPTDNGKKIPWETCQTFSGSWGYYRDELTWKDNKQLLVLLIESVSKGGNVLLNVGPTGRGEIDYRAQNALGKIGDWMKYNGKSIYGCTQAPAEFEVPENSILTYNPTTNRLYIHLIDYPLENFTLKGMKGKIKYVQFLHDNSEIKITKRQGFGAGAGEGLNENDVNLSIPVVKPNVVIPVIEIILN